MTTKEGKAYKPKAASRYAFTMLKITPLAVVLAAAVVALVIANVAVDRRPDLEASYQALRFANLSNDDYETIGTYATVEACWAAVAESSAEGAEPATSTCNYTCVSPGQSIASERC